MTSLFGLVLVHVLDTTPLYLCQLHMCWLSIHASTGLDQQRNGGRRDSCPSSVAEWED